MRGTPDQLDREGHGRGIIPAYAGNTARTRRSSIRPRDHPRICGEHSHSPSAMSVPGGSSPHMRGTPSHHAGLGYGGGIIPAYAGNTVSYRPIRLHRMGSSPHMRGTPSAGRRFARPRRIIPAYAGNTGHDLASCFLMMDHPRICGEHLAVDRLALADAGSSPHMRGTHRLRERTGSAGGIIPAYAGNTRRPAGACGLERDHPRICGEHVIGFVSSVTLLGSSPHMRGTLFAARTSTMSRGIIPAYAGNTCTATSIGVKNWDHPRICGEHSPFSTIFAAAMGSSPHMRGTRRIPDRQPAQGGIIPAYAGNTRYDRGRVPYRGDHPRICGEHINASGLPAATRGSSPHMRGTPNPGAMIDNIAGIIPAYAGNTLRDYSNFVVSKFMSFVFHLV